MPAVFVCVFIFCKGLTLVFCQHSYLICALLVAMLPLWSVLGQHRMLRKPGPKWYWLELCSCQWKRLQIELCRSSWKHALCFGLCGQAVVPFISPTHSSFILFFLLLSLPLSLQTTSWPSWCRSSAPTSWSGRWFCTRFGSWWGTRTTTHPDSSSRATTWPSTR